MKMMPAKDLISMLQGLSEDAIVSERSIAYLFEKYGDDYFKEPGDSAWELCKENGERKEWSKKIRR